LLHSTKSDNIL